jgi:hypothetical protein
MVRSFGVVCLVAACSFLVGISALASAVPRVSLGAVALEP